MGKKDRRMVSKTNWIGIDTEWYGHYGALHRPGGSFACLTADEGSRTLLIQDFDSARQYLRDKQSHRLVFQNAAYDIRQLRDHGLVGQDWRPDIWDTLIVEKALYSGYYQKFGLQDLARRWLSKHVAKELGSTFADATSMNTEMKQYATADAELTRKVSLLQNQYVENSHDTFAVYHEIDTPALWAILDMAPIRVDVDAWLDHSDTLLERGLAIQDKLGFNVKSQPQVQKALKGTGLKLRSGTSCNSQALEGWRIEAEEKGLTKRVSLISEIQEARKLRDAASKYGRRWIETNVEDGEWVYPSWKVTGAKTGRMSCSDPNMQNIPAREMPIYRSFFLANDGNTMVISDVAQQEPRFSAFLSKDKKLVEEILNEVDLHQQAADHFGLKSRSKGKVINLGLNYGMSAHGLASRLDISLDEAERGLRNRRNHYSRYYAWQDRQKRLAERLGYVETAIGRRVWVNKYNIQWERNAINAPIQGSAADQTKLALVYIHEQCAAAGIKFPVTMVIHDEIVAQAPRGTVTQYKKIIKEAWQEAGKKLMPTIPTEVEMMKGKTWLEGK